MTEMNPLDALSEIVSAVDGWVSEEWLDEKIAIVTSALNERDALREALELAAQYLQKAVDDDLMQGCVIGPRAALRVIRAALRESPAPPPASFTVM